MASWSVRPAELEPEYCNGAESEGKATADAIARLERIGVSPDDLAAVRAELHDLVGRPVPCPDVFWVIANLRLLDAAAAEDWAGVVAIYREMSAALRCESRATAELDEQRRLAEHRAAARVKPRAAWCG